MDITTEKHIVELKSPVVCRCPSCGRDIRASQRLSYPRDAVGKFAPVYRCGCGRHIGEPTANYAGASFRTT